MKENTKAKSCKLIVLPKEEEIEKHFIIRAQTMK
jgi:hypothetical protein